MLGRYRGRRFPCYRFAPIFLRLFQAPPSFMRLTNPHAWYIHSGICSRRPECVINLPSPTPSEGFAVGVFVFFAHSVAPFSSLPFSSTLIAWNGQPLEAGASVVVVLFRQPCQSGGGAVACLFFIFFTPLLYHSPGGLSILF